MRATIDQAGRLVIPKPLRDRVGLQPGEVEIVEDGSGIRIEPIADASLVEREGRLVIAGTGKPIDDTGVQAIRDAVQR